MTGYCEKHKCNCGILFVADGKWIVDCPYCKEENEHQEKIISGLIEIAEHFKMVQRTQQEAGKYVSVNFKRFENICLDAVEMLNGNVT